jgi:histidyl-tRNA synthetase
MGYANAKNIPYVLLVGEEEINSKQYTLRDMETGEQQALSAEKIIEELS